MKKIVKSGLFWGIFLIIISLLVLLLGGKYISQSFFINFVLMMMLFGGMGIAAYSTLPRLLIGLIKFLDRKGEAISIRIKKKSTICMVRCAGIASFLVFASIAVHIIFINRPLFLFPAILLVFLASFLNSIVGKKNKIEKAALIYEKGRHRWHHFFSILNSIYPLRRMRFIVRELFSLRSYFLLLSACVMLTTFTRLNYVKNEFESLLTISIAIEIAVLLWVYSFNKSEEGVRTRQIIVAFSAVFIFIPASFSCLVAAQTVNYEYIAAMISIYVLMDSAVRVLIKDKKIFDNQKRVSYKPEI